MARARLLSACLQEFGSVPAAFSVERDCADYQPRKRAVAPPEHQSQICPLADLVRVLTISLSSNHGLIF